MAKKTFVQLVDDFTGEPIADGEGRTVRFSFDGADYEIDLSNDSIDDMTRAFEEYVRASRRVSGRGGSRKGSGSRGSGSGETAAIREWAESQGIKVASRGRIPADVVERYRNR